MTSLVDQAEPLHISALSGNICRQIGRLSEEIVTLLYVCAVIALSRAVLLVT